MLFLLFLLHLPLAYADTVHVGGSTVEIVYHTTPEQLSKKQIKEWVTRSASAVANLLGKIPVDKLHVEIIENHRNEEGVFGQEFGGERVKLYVGKKTPASALPQDWMLVHELLHLALPDLDDEYLWAEEGLSTYLEPIARARATMTSEQEMWEHFAENLPLGEPQAGDEGLNKTHTWARTYWGGALFWFTADLAIRRETGKTLIDALKASLKAGGNALEDDWPIEKVLRIGDEAIGKPILARTYKEMALSPGSVDLKADFTLLGIEKDGAILHPSTLRATWMK